MVWQWRRQSRRGQSHRSESVGYTASQITVTPFDPMGPTLTGAESLDAGPRTGQPQQRLVSGPFPQEGPPLPSPRVLPIPVGLSSKELAQLRSRSQPTDGWSSNPLLNVTTDRGAATSSHRPKIRDFTCSRKTITWGLRCSNLVRRDHGRDMMKRRQVMPVRTGPHRLALYTGFEYFGLCLKNLHTRSRRSVLLTPYSTVL